MFHRFRQAIRTHADAGLILALVLAVFAYLPLLADPGLVNTRAGGDSPFLLVRLHQMTVALRDGVFPVRWMPDAAYGLGYPFFNFYAPLPYYLASGLYFLGLGFIGALKATQVIGFIVASIAMYQLARELWTSRPAGLLASLAYTYAPFHLANIYVRGDSLGEFWAFAFYPLIFLAIRRVRTHPTLAGVAGLALSYAGLILSHNISAMIFTPFMLLYAVFCAGVRETRRQVYRYTGTQVSLSPRLPVYLCTYPSLILTGLLLGLVLSAWYWAPALAERGAVQLEQNLTGYFFYGEHFRTKNLVQTSVLFNYTISRNNTPFALGLVQAIGIGLGLFSISTYWLHRRRIAPEVAAIVVILFLAVVLITPLSRPVWDHVPLLAFAQFPWRILSVVAFAGSLITGAMIRFQISKFNFQIRDLGWVVWSLAILVGAILAASVLLPLPVDYLPVTDADVSPERLALYELFTGNIGSTVRAEYLPHAVNPRPLTSPFLLAPERTAQPVVLGGRLANAEQVERRSARQRWRIAVASTEARLAFPLFAFPGWVARIDGQPAPSQPADGLGYLTTAVPQGEHIVDLELTRTPVRLAGEILGLVTWLVLLAALAGAKIAQVYRLTPLSLLMGRGLRSAGRISALRQTNAEIHCPSAFVRVRLRPILGWPGSRKFLVISWLILVAFMTSAGSTMRQHSPGHVSSALSQTDTMDFQVMPYLHPNPDGVYYGDRIRLRNYTLSGDPNSPSSGWPRVNTGQTFTATLAWEGAPPAEWRVEVALVSPALPLLDAPIVADRSEMPLASVTRHILNIPIETTPGLYLLRLEVTGTDRREVRPHTRRGRQLDTTYLTPVWIIASATSRPPGSPLARFQRGIVLERGQFRPLSPQTARVDLVWRAESAPAANYLTSIRLLAADGKVLAATDQPPLYGFAPTATWPLHTPIYDQRWLKLPAGLTTGDDVRLQVVVYVAGTLQELGTAEIPGAIKNQRD